MAPAQPELKKVRCTRSALLDSIKLLFGACLVLQLPCDLIMANFSFAVPRQATVCAVERQP
jgi:hypothetical protein